MNPASPSLRYNELAHKRLLPRTLMGGSEAMRAAGAKFCPKHVAENQAQFDARLAATVLYGGFKDAVTKQTGKLFGKPIVLGDDVPPEIADICDDIDGQGRAITPFMMDAMSNAMVDGVSFILVDFPDLSAPMDAEDVAEPTLADQKEQGARPYWVLITAANLLSWKSDNDGGHQELTEVRIRECVTIANDDFSEQVVEQIRVLRPGTWEVWQQMEDIESKQKVWVIVRQGRSTSDDITLVPIYTNRVGYMEGEPPMSALAELNQDHWISSSEQRHALTFLRFAMLAVTGVSQEDIKGMVVGPDVLLALPDGADAKFLEHTGKGIEAGFMDLDRIEKRMQSAGMTVRIENAGMVTATTSAIDSVEQNAALRAIAQGMKDSIEEALDYTAEMLGMETGGTVEVYDEFAKIAPQGTPDDLLKMRSTSNLTKETYWAELKRRHVLSVDFDAEKEASALAKDSATSPSLPPKPFSLAGR